MNHSNVGTKLQCSAKFGLIKIRTMTATQQGGAGFAEVLHLIAFTEQTLQHDGVSLLLSVGHTGAVGDTIPHAGHFYHAACRKGKQEKEKKKRKK